MYERVLVVDDSPEIREFLTEYILEPKGFEVLTARDGLMGLEMALATDPDLMIVDQQMPHLTGLELLSQLQQKGRQIPAILATAHGSEETAVAAFRLGIRDYLVKPFEPDEISQAVDKALRESRLQRERDTLVHQLTESNSQLQRRAQELNVLYGIGKSVAASLELEEVLHRVVESAVYLIGAEEGMLMLLDKERGELYIRASKNLDSQAQSLRKKVTDSLAGRVLQTKRAVVIGGDTREPRTQTGLLVKSLVYVPLLVQNEAIGVLGVNNHQKDIDFDANDVRTLSALAGYAAISIKNANLYSQMKRERNLLGVIINQVTDPVLVVDTNDVLLLINTAAGQAFKLDTDKVTGQPIDELFAGQEMLALLQTKNPVKDRHTQNKKLTAENGREYTIYTIAINDGGRSIFLREVI